MVIFHINTEKGFRGGEIQTLHLVRSLQLAGHQNCIFARPGSRILQEARVQEIPCFTLSMRGEWDFISGRTLRRLIHVQKPDILHAHTAHACSIALMARWPDGVPPIVYSRRVAFPSNKKLLRRKLKNVDAVLAVSQTVRSQMMDAGVSAERIYVAESGTDLARFENLPSRSVSRNELSIPEDAFVIGNVSHFEPQKGQEGLIRVFGQFAESHPSALLLLVGDGPDRSRCEEVAKNVGCENRIRFSSFRKDVERIYPAMDLFFLSSSHEGWSGVLREAMICGVPVVAVRQPSTEEQVRTGILVSNDPGEWLAALEKLHSDPALRNQMAENAKEYARQFTVETMVRKTEECYRKVLSYKRVR